MTKSDDAFRTISEVASELGLATHVLRFWESKFPQIKPLKRAGGRRYYRPDDVALLRRLQSLLHDEGYTIKGAQKMMREEGARKLIDEGNSLIDSPEENIDTVDAPEATMPTPTKVAVQLKAQVTPPPSQQNSTTQASLFDPAPQHPVPAGGEETTAQEDAMDEASFDADEDGSEDDSFFTDLLEMAESPDFDNIPAPAPLSHMLPDAPEPEPIYPLEAPQTQIIVKHALSAEKRQILQDVLSELEALKSEIDTAA